MCAYAYPLTNRILMRPIVRGESSIDDDDELVIGIVGVIEVAPANQRYADCFEVVANDLRRRRRGEIVVRIGIAVGDKCPIASAARGGEGIG